MTKIPCGGFYIDDETLGINEDGKLSVIGGGEVLELSLIHTGEYDEYGMEILQIEGATYEETLQKHNDNVPVYLIDEQMGVKIPLVSASSPFNEALIFSILSYDENIFDTVFIWTPEGQVFISSYISSLPRIGNPMNLDVQYVSVFGAGNIMEASYFTSPFFIPFIFNSTYDEDTGEYIIEEASTGFSRLTKETIIQLLQSGSSPLVIVNGKSYFLRDEVDNHSTYAFFERLYTDTLSGDKLVSDKFICDFSNGGVEYSLGQTKYNITESSGPDLDN